MRNINLTYLITVFILIMTIELSAQSNEMRMNNNRIDRDFIQTTEFKAKIDNDNLIENKINLFLEKANDSIYSIYVINKTSDSISVSKQDSHLFLIQEAKDKNGKWKPVEYWQYSTCGNSYSTKKIEPNGILKSKSLAYFGNFNTEIRFKLLNNNQIYYSNSIYGFINLSQFYIPKKLIEKRTFKKINKIGGSELLNKVIFLEPNGLEEYNTKQMADNEILTQDRQNKKE